MAMIQLKELVQPRTYRIRFLHPILGTVPKDKEIYKNYIESKKPPTTEENEADNIEEIEEKGWTGFMADANGLFLYNYMVLGFLKAAGEVLSSLFTVEKEKKGVTTAEKLKGIKSKIDKFVFCSPRRIYFNKQVPDGSIERPIRVMTRQGIRVSLTRSDYVNAGTELEFTLQLIPNKEITWDVIETLLQYGEYSGLGQFRNGSYGQFEWLR